MTPDPRIQPLRNEGESTGEMWGAFDAEPPGPQHAGPSDEDVRKACEMLSAELNANGPALVAALDKVEREVAAEPTTGMDALKDWAAGRNFYWNEYGGFDLHVTASMNSDVLRVALDDEWIEVHLHTANGVLNWTIQFRDAPPAVIVAALTAAIDDAQ